jgi:hypothetical protein
VNQSDIEHFSARALSEREAARRAFDPRAVAAHKELAERYEAVVRAYAELDRATMGRSSAPARAGAAIR